MKNSQNKNLQYSNQEIVYSGKIFAIVKLKQLNGEVWEIARRSPGVRIILKNSDGTYKLSDEFRHEHGSRGYRLPGGKMFDKLEDYLKFMGEGVTEEKLQARARADALREAEEEHGICKVPAEKIRFIEKSVIGSTVEWDLYVFEISDFKLTEQKTHGMEDIQSVNLTKAQILESIDSGKFNEDRIVPVLLRYLKNEG